MTECDASACKVAAFYLFTELSDLPDLKQEIHTICAEHAVRGTLLLAPEGINATVAGTHNGVDALLAFLRADSRMATLLHKESFCKENPFKKMKVKLRPEIIRLDVPEANAATNAGEYITSQGWDALIDDPDIAVIDTRNEYETRIGSFKGAIAPDTKNFRDFPTWAEEWAKDKDKSKRVGMFCTGGIRCEKSTAYMKLLGFQDVVHLQGGILQYLEDTGNTTGSWEGQCFVFDDRAAVDKDLIPGNIPCTDCGASCTADSLKHGKAGEILCNDCSGIFAASTAVS